MDQTTTQLPTVLDDPAPEIERLALRFQRANGLVMKLMNRLGGRAEEAFAALPAEIRKRIETVTRKALEQGYRVAATGKHAPNLGPRGPMALAALSGAAGGAGGLATSIAELPFTITVILHAIRKAAKEEGFNPDDPATRLEAIRVFAAGSPLAVDDGVNTGFLGARVAVSGPALQKVLAATAPKLAAALGPKLMAQSIPVLGALSGAALNTAFIGYYREMAHIRFALLRLSEKHGVQPVLSAFAKAVEPPKLSQS